MDTQLIIDGLKGLRNLPDIVLLLVILGSAIIGAQRGIVRTLCNVLGRLVAMGGALALAKLLAPVLARFIVTPIVGEVFEVRAADMLSRMPQAAAAMQASATEIATDMAGSLAFVLLFFIFLILMNVVVHMVAMVLKFAAGIGPIGLLNRLGGFALGAVFGFVLCFAALWALTIFAPGAFGELGILSPDAVAKTSLTAYLLGFVPGL